jgi:hypothetical protein
MVIVGDRVEESRGQTVVGDAPMLAARLQAFAQPDTVTIGPKTRRLIGGLFDYRDLGAIEVGGLAGPVPAWQVLRTSAIESRFEALRGSALTPLVGRNEEIDQLLRRWSRAKAGDGQVVLVTGEPGIGKSRLCAELEQRLHAETHLCRRYFCSPYHRDSVLSPSIDELARAAGFARDDPPTTRLGKLESLIGPVAAEEDVALLANLLSFTRGCPVQGGWNSGRKVMISSTGRLRTCSMVRSSSSCELGSIHCASSKTIRTGCCRAEASSSTAVSSP